MKIQKLESQRKLFDIKISKQNTELVIEEVQKQVGSYWKNSSGLNTTGNAEMGGLAKSLYTNCYTPTSVRRPFLPDLTTLAGEVLCPRGTGIGKQTSCGLSGKTVPRIVKHASSFPSVGLRMLAAPRRICRGNRPHQRKHLAIPTFEVSKINHFHHSLVNPTC